MWWLFFSILTAVSWGVGAVLMKKSYEGMVISAVLFINALIGFILLTPFALALHAQFVLLLLPAGLFVAAAYMFYYFVVDRGKVSLISVLNSIYPLFVLLFAALFLHETIDMFAKIGAFIIIAGIFLLSVENPREFFSQKSSAWFWWGIASAVFTGLADFIPKFVINNFSLASWMLAIALVWGIIALALLLLRHKEMSFPRNRATTYAIAGNASFILGDLFFYLASNYGYISLVSPITASYGAFTLLFAITWLKEKISLHQIIAAIVVIAGVIMVSMG